VLPAVAGVLHVERNSTTWLAFERDTIGASKKLIDELPQILQRRLSDDFERQRAAASRQLSGGYCVLENQEFHWGSFLTQGTEDAENSSINGQSRAND
jgi:hypothetical protein